MVRQIVKVIFIIALLLGIVYPGQADFFSDRQMQEPDIRIISSSLEQVVIEVSVPYYQIEQAILDNQEFDRLHVPGHSQSTEIGKPQVPVVGTLLGIPPKGDFSLEILSVESEVLKGAYQLAPAPRPVLAEDEFAAGEWRYKKDQAAYLVDQKFPDTAARLADEAWMRDQRIVQVEFFPFQYQARSGKLIWNSRIRVVLRLDGTAEVNLIRMQPPARTDDNPFENVLASSLLNYGQAREWRIQPKGLYPNLSSNQADLTSVTVNENLPGPRLRIPITENGIYKLDWISLTASGFLDEYPQINPEFYQLSTQGQEVAIYLFNIDENDDTFDFGDYILFYGQKFDGERLADLYSSENTQWRTYSDQLQLSDGSIVDWKPQFNDAMVEKYTDENIYWLGIGDLPGKRMDSKIPVVGDDIPLVNSYRMNVKAEESHWWKATTFTGEDTWFWDLSQTSSEGITRTFTTTIDSPYLGQSEDAIIRGEMVSFAGFDPLFVDISTKIYLNEYSTPIFEKSDWNIRSRLNFTMSVAHDQLIDGINEIKVYTQSPDGYTPEIYFDWFEVFFNREFIAIDNYIDFSIVNPGSWRFNIQGFGTTTEILSVINITDPTSPKLIDFDEDSGIISFQTDLTSTEKFAAAEVIRLDPENLFMYHPPRFDEEADYLIISHEYFLPEIDNGGKESGPLINLKQLKNESGYIVNIYDINDLYNQFNYGIYHPIAIKNFLKYTFVSWETAPQFVVLVGDGHWNFHGYTNPLRSYGGKDKSTIFIPPYLNWVDPWQGETDSTSMLATIIGDDPLADLFISRIPINSKSELENVVNKVDYYETQHFQPWQDNHLFIADNIDAAGNFSFFAEGMISDFINNRYNPYRLYQDIITDPDELNSNIVDTINITGTVIINYIGHGSITFWANRIFSADIIKDDIIFLDNGNQLPVVLSMTCWDGYFIYPGREGLIEQILRADGKGAVAAFSPTGLGVASGHDHLHRGFYDALIFQGENTLGSLTQAAKMRLYQTGGNYDLLHTFTIFGDPALQIPITRRVYLPAIEK